MTQPYPPQYAAPQYPPQQQAAPQQYAPPSAQPNYGYPPQQGAYPAQPSYGPPAPQYGPPPGYGYPPQQGAYPTAPPQAPAQQPVSASLSDFYLQPSTGWGPSITPTGATPDGHVVVMVVAQHITEAHVEHKTKFQSTELDYYANGKPKLSMKVPVNVPVGTPYWGEKGMQTVEDGRAQLYLQGSNKDLMGAAIAAAGGNPVEPPELGSLIVVTKTHNRRNRSGTNSAVTTFQYFRPGPDAMQYAAQNAIAYPDLSTPRPTSGGETGGNAAAEVPSAGPAVQQQAATPPPVVQPPAPQMAPPTLPQAPPQQYAAPAPGTYATAPGQIAHPTPNPMAPPTAPQQAPQMAAAPPPVAPGIPAGMNDPGRQALLAHLTQGVPLPAQAPPAPAA